MKNYQVYPNTYGQQSRDLYVRVRCNGTFKFNRAASRLLKTKEINAVLLLWDAQSRSIAFRAAKENDHGAFKLNPGSDGTHFKTKDFFPDIGCDLIEDAINLSATWNDAELTLELEPITREK